MGGTERNSTGGRGFLRLWTVGSAWFSGEDEKKGSMTAGQFADLAVLSADYFAAGRGGGGPRRRRYSRGDIPFHERNAR